MFGASRISYFRLVGTFLHFPVTKFTITFYGYRANVSHQTIRLLRIRPLRPAPYVRSVAGRKHPYAVDIAASALGTSRCNVDPPVIDHGLTPFLEHVDMCLCKLRN